jgi:hypothetical protein
MHQGAISPFSMIPLRAGLVPPAEALCVTISVTTATTTISITIITTFTTTTTTTTTNANAGTTAIATASNCHPTTITIATTVITNLLSCTQALCHEQRRCGFLTAEVQRIFRVSEQVRENV